MGRKAYLKPKRSHVQRAESRVRTCLVCDGHAWRRPLRSRANVCSLGVKPRPLPGCVHAASPEAPPPPRLLPCPGDTRLLKSLPVPECGDLSKALSCRCSCPAARFGVVTPSTRVPSQELCTSHGWRSFIVRGRCFNHELEMLKI